MQRMKKIFAIMLCFLCLITLSGCYGLYGLKESGDFKYNLRADETAYIYELSEQGSQKETIICPNRIDGYTVYIGATIAVMQGTRFTIRSNALEKMYFNTDILLQTYSNHYVKCYFIDTGGRVTFFLPYVNYNLEEFYNYCNVFLSNESISVNPEIINRYSIKIANVSYYYNYEKDGYKTYFIDDVDDEIIKNIPPVPIREGYIFDGWYKEAECIHKWDFKNDIILPKVYDEEGNYQYSETILYAKWK